MYVLSFPLSVPISVPVTGPLLVGTVTVSPTLSPCPNLTKTISLYRRQCHLNPNSACAIYYENQDLYNRGKILICAMNWE